MRAGSPPTGAGSGRSPRSRARAWASFSAAPGSKAGVLGGGRPGGGVARPAGGTAGSGAVDDGRYAPFTAPFGRSSGGGVHTAGGADGERPGGGAAGRRPPRPLRAGSGSRITNQASRNAGIARRTKASRQDRAATSPVTAKPTPPPTISPVRM